MQGTRGCELVLEGLGKRHTRADGTPIVALDALDLRIEPSTVHAVIGPSGAGKTSLFRCAATLQAPDSGRLLLDGVDLPSLRGAALRQARRRIGLVFQQLHLLPSLDAAANVALPLRIAGVAAAEREARALNLLRWVGLEDRARSHPRELSGGQKQRVAIARALATTPSLLLCDEPTSALDPDTSLAIWDLLRRARDDHGVTVLLITHQLEAVRRIGDTVSTLERGAITRTQSVADWARGVAA